MQFTLARVLILALFIAAVVAIGGTIGASNAPGGWYASLNKPWFNPPRWLFAPAWTVLYVLIAIAGWRTFVKRRHSPAMLTWLAQLALNFLWSPVFFGLQRPALALAVVIGMLIAIMIFIFQSWNEDRIAAWLFVPYAAWVAFATLLNASVVWLN